MYDATKKRVSIRFNVLVDESGKRRVVRCSFVHQILETKIVATTIFEFSQRGTADCESVKDGGEHGVRIKSQSTKAGRFLNIFDYVDTPESSRMERNLSILATCSTGRV